jgi:hypothetical protein
LALVVASQTSEAGRLADSFFAWLFGSGGADELDRGVLYFLMQKGYHVGLFAVFGWLLSLRLTGRSRTGCVLWVVAAGVVAEALQLLVAGRHPHIGDAVLNVAAGTATVVLWFKFVR